MQPEPSDSIRIAGICGSLSPDGATRKALAIALQGAAEYDAETTLLELRDFNLVFYGSVPPQEVSIANSASVFDGDGTVKDPALEERLLNVGRQVVKFVSVQQQVQQDEFMKMWKTLPTW